MTSPFRILEKKRRGEPLSAAEVGRVVAGAADGSWGDAQLAAFLTSAAIHGLDEAETRALTRGMLESGEQWDLASEVPTLTDKHSTGGVGDKVSFLLCPLLASCDVPVAMLTGRGLGHTGGTADKLESIPGVELGLDRRGTLELVRRVGFAIGMATAAVAPADRRLYALRDLTATIDSIPLMTGSILSKKLAMGPGALVFDVKTGEGAFLPEIERGRELARGMVQTTRALGREASALITDMSQPLGRWVGHTSEVREVWDVLTEPAGAPADLLAVTFALGREVTALIDRPLTDDDLRRGLDSGRARELFLAWADAQGAKASWLAEPTFPLAPEEHVLRAPRTGVLARVANRQIGLLLAENGAGRTEVGGAIDHGVALHVSARLGDEITTGQELGRLYLRRRDDSVARWFAACFEIGDEGEAPELIREVIRHQ